MDDDSTRYYACLAVSVLVSNKEIEACVLQSGTLSMVLPFIDLHDPQEFATMDTSHQHGRSAGWLKRLVPVLSSKREEAQALAAFHMVMEAGIKAEQDRKEVRVVIEQSVDWLYFNCWPWRRGLKWSKTGRRYVGWLYFDCWSWRRGSRWSRTGRR